MSALHRLLDSPTFVPMPTPFQFKQFAIAHDATAGLKVTTDAVFFGAWTPLVGNGPLLDIGAGTGLLGLMAAQRFPSAEPIHLLEPQPEAAAMARRNAEGSLWKSRIEIIQQRIEDFSPTLNYTDILCNPPFFVESLPRQDATLAHALHADKDLLERWLRRAAGWLREDGRLHLMAQPSARLSILKLSPKLGLHVNQEAFLHHSPAHPAIRWMVSLSKEEGVVPRRLVWEIKDEAGAFDTAYQNLVRPFYLNM